jgi:hypothetical protein
LETLHSHFQPSCHFKMFKNSGSGIDRNAMLIVQNGMLFCKSTLWCAIQKAANLQTSRSHEWIAILHSIWQRQKLWLQHRKCRIQSVLLRGGIYFDICMSFANNTIPGNPAVKGDTRVPPRGTFSRKASCDTQKI